MDASVTCNVLANVMEDVTTTQGRVLPVGVDRMDLSVIKHVQQGAPILDVTVTELVSSV